MKPDHGRMVAEVKARISLRELFERDKHVLQRAGASLVCLSPFTQEKTPSCHVHDKEGYFKCFSSGIGGDCFTYWKETRKCDFPTAVKELAVLAGLGEGQTPAPVHVERQQEAVTMPPELADADLATWQEAVRTLRESAAEQERIAEWRGFHLGTVRWAVERGLMGLTPYMGEMREAFLVERPRVSLHEGRPEGIEGPGRVAVGFHVRLGPGTTGNPHPKASWRFVPRKGVGAWPFVLGEISTARVIFAVEGQWDALAMVDVMGWAKAWPEGTALVGMRGATSWKRFVDFFVWLKTAALFAFADADAAGNRWSEPGGFLDTVEYRFWRTFSFRPHAEGCKDLNDLVKAKLLDGEAFAEMFRRKIRRVSRKVKGGLTFYQWCVTKTDDPTHSEAARAVVDDRDRPKRRKALRVWERHWDARKVADELRTKLRAAWAEWRGGR